MAVGLNILLSITIGLALAQPVYAHGEIVYGARYYLPPGSQGTSHSHIYRIDPSGRNRRQLTFGNSDDELPMWKTGGRVIEFYRTVNPLGDEYLMAMRSDGSSLRKIKEVNHTDPYVDYQSVQGGDSYDIYPAPDGKHGCKPRDDMDGDDIADMSTHKPIAKCDCYGAVIWLSNTEFAAIDITDHLSGKYIFDVFDVYGKKLETIHLKDISQINSFYIREMEWSIQ